MNSFTRGDAVRGGAEPDACAPERWNDYGPAANRVFDDQVTKRALTVADDQSVALLARAIQHEIIPRLMLAHKSAVARISPPGSGQAEVLVEDVIRFTQLIMAGNDAMASDYINALRAQGAPVESIYLDLLAPSARRMGDLWNEDLCDFTEVTIGLGRLHHMLYQLGPEMDAAKERPSNGLSILLLPTPGEQHTFGLAMVAEFFRSAGWHVAGGPYEAVTDPAILVRKQRFDVVGFSLAVEGHLDRLSECITMVRKASKNPNLCVMVGGPAFANGSDYTGRLNADLVIPNGSQAPNVAREFLEHRQSVC
jgi:methanogenic corrinoid protein MtbC1